MRPRSNAVFLVALVLAAVLRLPDLTLRPMHADEAVHADKLGTLLEEGRYVYDSSEFHGPTLYYLTLPSAWLEGAARYVDIDEATLRVVPALLGVLLVVAHLGARPFLGAAGAAFAALLVGLSPAFVFYSRYYIHEIPLVLFTFGALLGAFSLPPKTGPPPGAPDRCVRGADARHQGDRDPRPGLDPRRGGADPPRRAAPRPGARSARERRAAPGTRGGRSSRRSRSRRSSTPPS